MALKKASHFDTMLGSISTSQPRYSCFHQVQASVNAKTLVIEAPGSEAVKGGGTVEVKPEDDRAVREGRLIISLLLRHVEGLRGVRENSLFS